MATQAAREASAKSRFEQAAEIVVVISLSLAALLTSWSVYQSARWTTVQSFDFARTAMFRTQASTISTRGDQLQALDVFEFSQWLNAYAVKNEPLQTFYRTRFRPEFRTAFEAWMASAPLNNPDAPTTPFAMPNYQLSARAQAESLERQADANFKTGQAAKETGDDYVEGNVILASAMFFAGIAQVFRVRPVRLLLIAISVATVVWAAVRVIGLPVHL